MKADIEKMNLFCSWELESSWIFVIKTLVILSSPAAHIVSLSFKVFSSFGQYSLQLKWYTIFISFTFLFKYVFKSPLPSISTFPSLNKPEFFFTLYKLKIWILFSTQEMALWTDEVNWLGFWGLTWKFLHQIVCKAEEMPYSLTDGEQTTLHCLSIN